MNNTVIYFHCRYLSRAIVFDAQTDTECFFHCNSWLAVDIGDCKLDQTFTAATQSEVKQLNNLFITNASR